VHRDVKPENMLFAASGVIKVTDFGLAKVVGGPGDSQTRLTRVGDVLGTPAYIAPEQVRRDGRLSPATDVYGLATMLYELLAGVLPFPENGRDVAALLFQHAYEPPVPLGDVAPGVPGPVAAVVMRALATDPQQRFATAESFGVALAGACAQAWGPGWLPAGEVPIMDAGPIMTAAGHPSGPPRPAGPPAEPAAGRGRGGDSAEHEKTLAAGPVSGNGETPGSPRARAAGTPPGTARPALGRRRIIMAVIVVLILIIAIVILIVMKPFTVYRPPGSLGLSAAITMWFSPAGRAPRV